jgi:hypothetical protein
MSPQHIGIAQRFLDDARRGPRRIAAEYAQIAFDHEAYPTLLDCGGGAAIVVSAAGSR